MYMYMCVCVCRCDFVLDVIFSMLQNLFQILAPFSHFLDLVPHIYVFYQKKYIKFKLSKFQQYITICVLGQTL
jgi:hypothetical protein